MNALEVGARKKVRCEQVFFNFFFLHFFNSWCLMFDGERNKGITDTSSAHMHFARLNYACPASAVKIATLLLGLVSVSVWGQLTRFHDYTFVRTCSRHLVLKHTQKINNLDMFFAHFEYRYQIWMRSEQTITTVSIRWWFGYKLAAQ